MSHLVTLRHCVTASHWPGRVTNCSLSSVNTRSCVQALLLVCSSDGAGRCRYRCRYLCRYIRVDISRYLHCLCSRPGGCRQSAASSASVTSTGKAAVEIRHTVDTGTGELLPVAGSNGCFGSAAVVKTCSNHVIAVYLTGSPSLFGCTALFTPPPDIY